MTSYRNWIKPTPLRVTHVYGDGQWQLFKDLRSKHNENICNETNKLVLRLDRLINSPENDLNQSVVEWQSDELVKLCPFCAKQFTFARRRHHCRACGAILCNNCSHFLEYKQACRLVKPTRVYTKKFDDIEDRLEEKSFEEKPKIRCCEDCIRLIDKRIQIIDNYYCRPSFMDFYERFRKNMSEADELILSHDRLISEKKQPTPELKDKIQELKQVIVTQSSELKKMIQQSSGKEAHLMSAINQSVGYWIKENINSKARRIHGPKESGEVVGSGFVPQQSFSSMELLEDENPFLIQIKNLEEFIRQAKLADKYEEVAALEQSKRELEIEYFSNQLDLNISVKE